MELCLIAEPDMGIITNIGKEHLEGFGGIEGVAKAESELFDYVLKNNGYAFVNMDDKWLANMGKRLLEKSSYSMQMDGISEVHTVPSIVFHYKGEEISSVLMGEHNFQNIAATIAVAQYLNISLPNIKKGIEAYVPSNNRSQLIHTEKGNTVLLDAYNANPSSVEMALRTFEKMEGEKIALLGDMFELGIYEAQEHQAIAELCKNSPINQCFLVGLAFDQTQVESANVQTFKHKEEALIAIRQKGYKRVNVLIKGSRGMKMEDFLKEF